MSWSLFGISAVFLLYLVYRRRDSEQIMIVLSAILALFTMIFLPFVGYNYFDDLEITRLYLKQMRVPSVLYFKECQPIIYAFVFGVVVFQFFDEGSNRLEELRSFIKRLTSLSWRELIFLFLLFQSLSLLESSVGTSFQFLFFGLGSAKYGMLLVLFLKSQILFVRVVVLVVPLFEALQSGMFQGYLALIFTILLLAGWLRNGKQMFFLILIAGLLGPILLIGKNELRRAASANELTFQNFGEVLYATQVRESERAAMFGFSVDGSFELYRRLNQGWLLSAVIEKKGRTEESHQGLLLESMLASVVPRFFWPDKPMAGGREKISKYTDVIRQGSTSMNISPFGDILVEFSGLAACVVSFVYAIILCKLLMLMIEFASVGRISFLILPLILSQIYKVETDIVTVFNFMIKGLIFGRVLLVAQNWMIKRIPG